MTRYFYCYLALCCIVQARSCRIDRCRRQKFFEMKSYQVMLEPLISEQGPWPWFVCQRLCRQYLECLTFSMLWSSEQFGLCNIYRDNVKYTNLSYAHESSAYMPCPRLLDWYPHVNKCYSTKLHGPANWTVAVEECKKLDPEAKLMEPRNKKELAIMADLAAGQVVWTGIYRPPSTAVMPSCLRYHSDGSLVIFAPWAAGQPDGRMSDNCVYAAPELKYLWGDTDCAKEIEFVCEI